MSQYTDPSNRLSFAIEPNLPNYGGWYQAYNYDAFGNRAIPPGYDVPNPDQTPAALTEFTLNRWKRGSGDTYDGSGNQTGVATRSNPGATVNVFTYDGENRMVTSNIANMGTVTYSYDGEGRRVQKSYTCSTGTCTTVFVYDAMGQLAAEYSTAPNPVSGTEYLTADSLGSTRLVTDGSGGVAQCYDYLPFGEEIRQGFNGRGSCYPPTGVYPHPADATSMKFTGKERDMETGLDYFGARYLSSSQSRFTSPDPLLNSGHPWNPQSWNRYAYALNNPLKIIDPTGLYNVSCASDDQMCNQAARNLRRGLTALQKKVDKMKDGDAKTRLQHALSAMGTENDRNNVNVSFGTLSGTAAGETKANFDQSTSSYTSFDVKFDPSKLSGTNDMAIAAAHEGTHVGDHDDPMGRSQNPATAMDGFQYEYRGYQTSAWAAQALGVSPLSFAGDSVIWNSSWKTADRQTLMDHGITRVVTSPPYSHPENPIHNPWPDRLPERRPGPF